MMAPEYFTREEFAAKVRVSVSTIDRWVAQGILAYWQPLGSKRILIPVDELTRHLKKNESSHQESASSITSMQTKATR